MKDIHLVIILFITSLLIVGCGSDDSNETSVDTNRVTEFKFFPPGFFVAGYREEFNFNGIRQRTDTNEQTDTFTHTPVIITQPEDVFNLTSTIPILSNGEIGFDDGSSTPVSVTQYFTITGDDRRFIGSVTILFGITTTTTATSTTAIPETVTIGSSGEVGRYIDNFGQVIVISWDLEDAGNNQAQLTWTTRTLSATDNSILSSGEDVSIIDTNGNRLSKSIRVEFFNLTPNLLDTWAGTKIP